MEHVQLCGGDPLSAVDPDGLCPCGNVDDLLKRARGDKRDWSKSADRSDVNSGFGKDTYKCNLFADDQYEAAGYNLPNVGGMPRSWMNRRGIQTTASGQQRHHWLFERNQGIGKNIPDAVKNQPWNTNPISAEFNNWLSRHPGLAWMGGPSWAGEMAAGGAMTAAGGGDDCTCNQ